MESWNRILFLGAILVTTGHGEVPDGYILQVNPNCGSDGIDDAEIQIITDLQISARAVCDTFVSVNFTSTDTVNFVLPASYPSRGSSPCVFHKRQDSKTYVLKVIVSHGPYLSSTSSVHEVDEEYTVSCTFGPHGADATALHNVPEGLLAPLEMQTNVGGTSSSVLELQLVDVLGRDLSGVNVDRERKVWLKAVSSGSAGEIGLKPVSCTAEGLTTNRTYPILRAGCGDGLVFEKHKGFTTDGLTVGSPYFPMFSMAGDPVIRFECNFTMCNTTCDGSSCRNQVKRSIRTGFVADDVEPLTQTLYTAPIASRSTRRFPSAVQRRINRGIRRIFRNRRTHFQ